MVEAISSSPRFYDCSISDCPKAAIIGPAGCEHCRKHYCSAHVNSAIHDCPKELLDEEIWLANQANELKSLRARINDEALISVASNAKQGLKCRLEVKNGLDRGLMGGMNVHLPVIFEDGTRWLARFPRENYLSFSDDFTNDIIRCECATLKWLENVDIRTPALHAYGLKGDPNNIVGVSYMLIDELPGKPYIHLQPSIEQQEKVCNQLADMFNQLYQHPLDQIGCLTFAADGKVIVSPIVNDRTAVIHKIGPFGDARVYYAAWANSHLELILDQQICIQWPVDAYLMFKHLRILAEEGKWNHFERELDHAPFFLKHMDDKGDHIFVDEDYNITGVIDWTFARAVPIYEAFGPSLLTVSLEGLFDGRPGLTDFDRKLGQALDGKKSPLARYAFAPDLVRRMSSAVGVGMSATWVEVLALFQGICKTLNPDEIVVWEAWKEKHLRLWSDDERLQKVVQCSMA